MESPHPSRPGTARVGSLCPSHSTPAMRTFADYPSPLLHPPTQLTIYTQTETLMQSFPNGAQAGSIDVFDSNFNPFTTSGGFSDPNLPAGFIPYNITTIGNNLFVTYSGTGAVGQVDEFDPNGNLIMSFTDPSLDAPW